MVRCIHILIYSVFAIVTSHAQALNYTPEVVAGNRSTAYQHFIGYHFNDTWSINNLTLFDTEYNDGNNNIFFIRNTLSYSLNHNIKANVAFGIKNPGSFATISAKYDFSFQDFKFSYTIGTTYQNGLTLEQTLILNYTPKLAANIEAYINLFAVVATDLKILNRGIQQFRLGIKKRQLITGLAMNLDQFTESKKTLENSGLFLKYNF